MPLAADHDLGRGAVVAGEEHERVVKHPHCLELRENPADLLVHAVDHRRMDRHLVDLKLPLLGREFLPWKRSVDLTIAEQFQRVWIVVRRADLRLHRCRSSRHDAHRLEPLDPCLLHGVPAGPVAVAVFRDELRRCVQREVGRRERDIVEERCAGVFAGMVGQTSDSVVADRRGGIEIISHRHLSPILDDAGGCKKITVALGHIERPRKTLRPRVAVDMPLAGVI